MTVYENYRSFKEMLKDTEAAKYFDDKYAFAYIEQEKDLDNGGKFVSFQTGYNRDRVISFVKINNKLYVKTGYRNNYGNYSCTSDGKTITEHINYGFGSNKKIRYDLSFNEISEESHQDYGCCCD